MRPVTTVADPNASTDRPRTGFADLRAALERLEIGPRDRSQISDAEAAFLFRFVRDHEVVDTLEVGCGLGKSAVSIMLGTGRAHVAVDPFQANYDFRGVRNVARAGLSDAFELRAERSCVALPALLVSRYVKKIMSPVRKMRATVMPPRANVYCTPMRTATRTFMAR